MRRDLEKKTDKERDNKEEPKVISYLFLWLSSLLSFSFFRVW